MADTGPNRTDFDPKREKAALMVAEDDESDRDIARKCNIAKSTLELWKQDEAFKARVAAHRVAFRERILSTGFADKVERVRVLDRLAAATLHELAKLGGFYREEVKIAANGEHVSYQVFDKPKHDTLRGYLDDIAHEMGDRKTVAEVSGPDGEPLVLGLVGVDIGKV
jgi:muconolactone delta-isomerase